MNKAYLIKFDYSVLAVARTRADAEEMVLDCAMEQGHYYFNLYKGAGYADDVAIEEANRNMSYFFIDEIPLI
jgi:hypothetical protein